MPPPPPSVGPPPPKKSVPKPVAVDPFVEEQRKAAEATAAAAPASIPTPPSNQGPPPPKGVPPPPSKKSVPKPAAVDPFVEEQRKAAEATAAAAPASIPTPPSNQGPPPPKGVPPPPSKKSVPKPAVDPFVEEQKKAAEVSTAVPTPQPLAPAKLVPKPLAPQPVEVKPAQVPEARPASPERSGMSAVQKAAANLAAGGGSSLSPKPMVDSPKSASSATASPIPSSVASPVTKTVVTAAVPEPKQELVGTSVSMKHELEAASFQSDHALSHQELCSEQRETYFQLINYFTNKRDRILELAQIRLERKFQEAHVEHASEELRRREAIRREEESSLSGGLLAPFQHGVARIRLQLDQERGIKEQQRAMREAIAGLQKSVLEDVRKLQDDLAKAEHAQSLDVFKKVGAGLLAESSGATSDRLDTMKSAIAALEEKLGNQLTTVVAVQQQQQEGLGLNKSALQRRMEEEDREKERDAYISKQLKEVEKSVDTERLNVRRWAQRYETLVELSIRQTIRDEADAREFIEDAERSLKREIVNLYSDILLIGHGSPARDRRQSPTPAPVHPVNKDLNVDEALRKGAGELGRFLNSILGYSLDFACEYSVPLALAGYGAAVSHDSSQHSSEVGNKDGAWDRYSEDEMRGLALLGRIRRSGWEDLLTAMGRLTQAELAEVGIDNVAEQRVFLTKVGKACMLVDMGRSLEKEASQGSRKTAIIEEALPVKEASPKRNDSFDMPSPNSNKRVQSLLPTETLLTVTVLDAFVESVMTGTIPAHDKLMMGAWDQLQRRMNHGAGGGLSTERIWDEVWRYAWHQDVADQNVWEDEMIRIRKLLAAQTDGLYGSKTIVTQQEVLVDPIQRARKQHDSIERIVAATNRDDTGGGSPLRAVLRNHVEGSGGESFSHGHRLVVLSWRLQRGPNGSPPQCLLPTRRATSGRVDVVHWDSHVKRHASLGAGSSSPTRKLANW